jgi:hypothetical protein
MKDSFGISIMFSHFFHFLRIWEEKWKVGGTHEIYSLFNESCMLQTRETRSLFPFSLAAISLSHNSCVPNTPLLYLESLTNILQKLFSIFLIFTCLSYILSTPSFACLHLLTIFLGKSKWNFFSKLLFYNLVYFSLTNYKKPYK